MSISSSGHSENKIQNSAEEKSHFYWLDWTRFVAAFMVMAWHARGGNWVDWGDLDPRDKNKVVEVFFALTHAAPAWVLIFFSLSGFLVGGKVLERLLNQTFDPAAYAIDRISRVWVPLIPALLLTAISAYYCGYPAPFSQMVGNLLAMQEIFCDNYGHNAPLWTLGFEVWFYALTGFAAAIVLSPAKHRGWLWLGLFVCLVVFTVKSPIFLFGWLLGAFSYPLISKKRQLLPAMLGLLLAVFGGTIIQLPDARPSGLGSLRHWFPSHDVGLLIECLGTGIFFAYICRGKPVSRAVQKFERLGSSLAAFSYTLYLTHMPILDFWQKFVPGRARQFDFASCAVYLGEILSCLFIAWLLYLPFEARTHDIRRRLKSWLQA